MTRTRGRPTPEQLAEIAAVFRDCGGNICATARAKEMDRTTARRWVRWSEEAGYLNPGESDRDENRPSSEAYVEARAAKLHRFQKKKAKGDWRKPVLVHMPPGPFRLKVFGDPHLDADGCDYELFERHWLEMDAAGGVYGLCVGDFFNNWLRVLSHLWKHEGDPDDAWTCFEWLMAERGDALLAACSGNHDDWTHAPADPIDMLMKRHGVRYRVGAIRLALAFPGSDPVTIAMRHKWRGSSIYSAAHGIRRAVEKGWRDLVAIGGHIHQDEPRMYTHPDGAHSHICQVSSFKAYDDYVDIHGLQGPRISPVWDLVIDPRLPDSDADKVKVFWDSERAAKYLEAIR